MAGRKRTLMPLSSRSIIVILIFILYGLGLNACLQSIRRPESNRPTWTQEHAAENPGAPSKLQESAADSSDQAANATVVNLDSINTTNPSTNVAKPAGSPNATLLASLKPTNLAAPTKPAFRAPTGKRQRKITEEARQVNEYALWCIENSMWKEAQLHLENALLQDSLSASFHNNLGIIYERLGQPEKAIEAYKQAGVLQPDKQAYLINLQRLEARQKHSQEGVSDSLQTAPIDSLESNTDGAEVHIDSFKDGVADLPAQSLTTE
jgi:tetratricopeptide (TPR) repeat protein